MVQLFIVRVGVVCLAILISSAEEVRLAVACTGEARTVARRGNLHVRCLN